MTTRIFFFAVLMMIPLSVMGWILTPQAGAQPVQDNGFVQSLYFYVSKTINAARFAKPLNWINLLFLGVLASGMCFAMWNKACEIVGTVKVKIDAYFETLTSEQLLQKPDGCEYTRLELILAQFRHLMWHVGLSSAITFNAKHEWNAFTGLSALNKKLFAKETVSPAR